MTITRLLSVCLLFSINGVIAETVDTRKASQAVNYTQDLPMAGSAEQWGLTRLEWTQYQQVMGERRGLWSPGLDPITALGVSTENTGERNRFAELFVRTEFERTRKELAFQLAVDRAWSRLYPDTPRLGHRRSVSETDQAKYRYALIVTPNCKACEAVLSRRLADMIREAKEGVDVHVVGTAGNDQVLATWIDAQPALAAALKAGSATLNHGNQFQDLKHFPAIYSKAGDGQWTREL